jgi:hypothetical protein
VRSWQSEVDGWREAVLRVPAFAGITYRSIGPMGFPLESKDANVALATPAGV